MKVLVLEPDLGPRAVLSRTLYLRGHEVTGFGESSEALSQWQFDEYPLVVVAWRDDGSTADFCRQLRILPAGSDAVVLVVGREFPPQQVPQIAAWADDLVPIDPEQFATRMAVAERRVAAAAQRREAQQQLTHQALHDALTDLPNRALFADRLDQNLRAAQRQRQILGLLIMDLDRFKEINDTYGHHVGDLTLREIAVRMRAVLRASDTVARFGGDEFAVVLPSIGETENAVTIARKVVQVICEPCVLEGHTVTVGASIGVAMFPTHGSDVEALLLRADAAMYTAKRAGGGVALAAPETSEASVLVPTRTNGSHAAHRPTSASPAAATLASAFGPIDRRSYAELLRTIGQDLDRNGAQPRAIICEANGYRVREGEREDASERWFPIDELVRESMSRALRRQPH